MPLCGSFRFGWFLTASGRSYSTGYHHDAVAEKSVDFVARSLTGAGASSVYRPEPALRHVTAIGFKFAGTRAAPRGLQSWSAE